MKQWGNNLRGRIAATFPSFPPGDNLLPAFLLFIPHPLPCGESNLSLITARIGCQLRLCLAGWDQSSPPIALLASAEPRRQRQPTTSVRNTKVAWVSRRKETCTAVANRKGYNNPGERPMIGKKMRQNGKRATGATAKVGRRKEGHEEKATCCKQKAAAKWPYRDFARRAAESKDCFGAGEGGAVMRRGVALDNLPNAAAVPGLWPPPPLGPLPRL